MPTSAYTSPAARAAPRRAESTHVAWLVLTVLLLFSIAAPLNQSKVPPILPVLMDAFALSVGQAGWLNAVFAVTGLVLALPAGLILQRLGSRLTGLLAGGSIVLGALLGVTSATIGPLLAGRVVEGIGTSFMAVLAPATIAVWFDARQRGLAMGIWAAWVPIGSMTMMVLAPALAQAANWQAVWWFGLIYALVVTTLFLIVIRPKAGQLASENAALDAAPALKPAASLRRIAGNRDIWLIGAAFGCFVMASAGFSTFLPTYLNLEHGMPLSQAALLASITSLLMIVSCPVGGILSDRFGTRRRLYLLGMVLMTAILPLTGFVPAGAIVLVIVAQGLVGGLIPTNIFSAGVEVVGDARLSGMAMGVVMLGQNAGMLAGPAVFGGLVESAGWPAAYASLSIMCLAGLTAGWLAKAR